MKRKLLQLFAVCMAIVTAIPIANAAQITYSVKTTSEWEKAGTYNGAKTIAVSNNMLYLLLQPTTETTIAYVGQNQKWTTFESGYGTWAHGFAFDNDDAGNIVMQGNSTGGATTKLVVYPAGATSNSGKKEITITSPGGRADFIRIQGNILSGKAYVWFAPEKTQNIVRVNIENGKEAGQTTWTHNLGANSSTELAYMLDDGRIFFHHRKGTPNYAYLLTVPANGGNVTSSEEILSGNGASNLTSDVFNIQGTYLYAYNAGNTAQDIRFNVKNLATGKDIATNITPFNGKKIDEAGTISYLSEFNSVGTIMRPIKVNVNTVDLYCYTPEHGASVYRVQANIVAESVNSVSASLVEGTNDNIKVSWTKPTNDVPTSYAVSYSSNGGSSWSDAVATNNLTHTFTNLTPGTYIFKVIPYYEQYLTYGGEKISNSVTVINATGASISNLAYKYVKNTVTDIGRQDITLTWDAPTGMVNTTVTGYKVYRNGSLLATLGADVTSYTNAGIKQNYTYKVVPLFESLAENASFGQEVTTTEVQAGVLVAPIISETRNYEGYSLVEIFYTMPGYAPYKPLYFNLYRDGKLIQAKLQSYNTLDESLVRASVETTVNYQVEAVYGTGSDVYPPIDSVKSNITTLTIAPRDWAKTGYILQEIYNVPITNIAADKKPNHFDNNNYYRQGQFRDGKWYIAQRSDNLSKDDENPNSGGGQIDSNEASATGGILVFNAENADQVKSGYEKIITKSAFENVGIAMDDAGTLFVRNNNFDKLKATVPTGHGSESAWGWMKDAFERRITEGTFYKRNADGSYTEVATKLDLSKIWTDNRWIDRMYFTGTASNGQVIGRSDYYHMYGDVLSAEGGYLVLSPSWTRTAFKVKIANGAYVSHEIVEFNRYENAGYLLEPKTGTENYGFHLDGRDDVTVQIRSNGYYGIHEWSEAGTSGWHPIFTADSRINNAGGTSIQAFGEVDGTGRHTGELFIITPQSMHSHNVGDFLVSRATKASGDDYADEGSLMPSTPVAQYVQTDERSNSKATNANGNWFHAEKGTYASAMKDDDECVDIYQYVPGTRFARYRLIPSNQFPPVQPSLNITTAYNDDLTDITHFDGVATWQRPAGFGRSTGSVNAKVMSYLFEMYNSKNELVATAELPELYKTDGTPVDDEYVYDFNYTDTTSKVDIDFGRYTVSVRVKYQTKDGTTYLSDPMYAEDIHDYPAKPAEDRTVDVFLKEDFQIDEWVQDENGKWVVESKKVNRYRVDLDFNKPDFSGEATEEPVTYYTIKAVVNRSASNLKGDTINIDNFLLHQGSEVKDGKIWAKTTATNMIPGTYNFNSITNGGDKAPYYTTIDANGNGKYQAATDGGSYKDVVLSYFYDAPIADNGVAVASNGEEITITNTPDNWEFIIVAHYAARNRYISKDATVGVSTEILTPTGVEVIGDGNIFAVQIYPIPAHSTITVKSPEAINSIVIYNEAGAEVMNIEGDGETMTTVNIESLATGYYFVKVNNQELVKIIKK